MADEHYELRRVSWHELFSFTHIFKSFRMAIQPGKLALALVAVLAIFLLGHGMDWVWGWGGASAHVGDPFLHYRVGSPGAYDTLLERREQQVAERLAEQYRGSSQKSFYFSSYLRQYRAAGGSMSDLFYQQFTRLADERTAEITSVTIEGDLVARVRQDPDSFWNAHVATVNRMLNLAEQIARDAAQAAETAIEAEGDPARRETLDTQLETDVVAARRARWRTRNELIDEPERVLFGEGIFDALVAHERVCFGNAVRSAAQLEFFSGFYSLFALRNDPAAAAAGQRPQAVPLPEGVGLPEAETLGFFPWLFLMLWGPVWLLLTHPLFGVLFLLLSLAIWAVLGGAIARMAALHAAREEKISLRQALTFSLSKFLSFFSAPLIPAAIILVLGVLLGLGGLLGLVPVGDIIVGALFFVALILGAIVAFLLIGLVAGFPLMYPTIAVEGSDSFDAISRSFSYVLGRPWRYGLYSLVAAVYGVICYLFIRLFAFLMLAATHLFVGEGFFTLGLGSTAAPEIGAGATKTDLLWTTPSFTDLAAPVAWGAMNWHEAVASTLIHVWIYLVVGLLLAFVLTFAVSAWTLIYYLLRRKVDATDLDDVYVEETIEQETQAQAPAAPEAAAPTETPAEPAEGQAPPPDEGPEPQQHPGAEEPPKE